jgi:hypothetical protein
MDLKISKKHFVLFLLFLTLLPFSSVFADEGDFFFSPEVGWSHFFSDGIKEGVYAGAHFGYDTSKNLSIELIMFYGDNNGQAGNPDFRYVLGGGGLCYKFYMGRFKPSLFAGANVAGIDFSDTGAQFKGGLYLGGAFEVYLNKVISLGLTAKYFPLIKTDDIFLLGFRFGFEL